MIAYQAIRGADTLRAASIASALPVGRATVAQRTLNRTPLLRPALPGRRTNPRRFPGTRSPLRWHRHLECAATSPPDRLEAGWHQAGAHRRVGCRGRRAAGCRAGPLSAARGLPGRGHHAAVPPSSAARAAAARLADAHSRLAVLASHERTPTELLLSPGSGCRLLLRPVRKPVVQRTPNTALTDNTAPSQSRNVSPGSRAARVSLSRRRSGRRSNLRLSYGSWACRTRAEKSVPHPSLEVP